VIEPVALTPRSWSLNAASVAQQADRLARLNPGKQQQACCDEPGSARGIAALLSGPCHRLGWYAWN
jgi:hypothetical protein